MWAWTLEWLGLLGRVVHVIAAIMWIGDSFLFMWLDSHLQKPEKPREGDVAGELWMTHSGGFYEVVKRRSLAALPTTLHWFKWESYSTWLSGFFLISVVYYLGGGSMLAGADSPLSHGPAVALSLGLLFGGVGLYQWLCGTALARNLLVYGLFGLTFFTALGAGLSQVYTGRAVFLQLGAMMGSIMSSNVLMRIIPAQREMLAATREGRPVDTSYGLRAKQHSTHNHYMTLPVLFTMLAGHFPTIHGHSWSWLLFSLISVFLVVLKRFMNQRLETPLWATGIGLFALFGAAAISIPRPAGQAGLLSKQEPVSMATVQDVVTARCLPCHATHPSNPAFPAAPKGLILEKPEEIAAAADRILVQAVHTQAMPLGNATGMTDQERGWLGAWIVQGARTDAPGPSALAPPAPAPAPIPTAPPADPQAAAEQLYTSSCALCHGATGGGDGPGAVSLNPPPRKFRDPAWQAATSDERLRAVILKGGAANGLSPLMPPNPPLEAQPEVLKALIRKVRALGEAGPPP